MVSAIQFVCPSCGAKRSLQYFFEGESFISQRPSVICGACKTSVLAVGFIDIDFQCPDCRTFQRARLPAKPVPLSRYRVANVYCTDCGYRGPAQVGKRLEIICTDCWARKDAIVDAWAGRDDDFREFCDACRQNRRHLAYEVFLADISTSGRNSSIQAVCRGCNQLVTATAEQLLEKSGSISCPHCGHEGSPGGRQQQQQQREDAPYTRKTSDSTPGDRKLIVPPVGIPASIRPPYTRATSRLLQLPGASFAVSESSSMAESSGGARGSRSFISSRSSRRHS
ncbi:unnamed protein product [Vitrella brassicaformis CCMP3155]|uniref:Uncharacterized protein n=2 Tax=Vitrella brassicaformis TaxID=1169539 RepID=A0A0G4EEQ2_VITBC|nr:unnamed protein product [Vitrella brassicaformis CCMP3155]|eukprot:CEL94022.1 unnamed protein product [Vitrella brassicaformis CCMP3155]